jgi:hypothetical protein
MACRAPIQSFLVQAEHGVRGDGSQLRKNQMGPLAREYRSKGQVKSEACWDFLPVFPAAVGSAANRPSTGQRRDRDGHRYGESLDVRWNDVLVG